MKLKPGLGASYGIRPGNGVGLFYSSWTHTGPLNEVVEALAANILVQFLSHFHHGTSLHYTLSTCLLFVQLQSM